MTGYIMKPNLKSTFILTIKKNLTTAISNILKEQF